MNIFMPHVYIFIWLIFIHYYIDMRWPTLVISLNILFRVWLAFASEFDCHHSYGHYGGAQQANARHCEWFGMGSKRKKYRLDKICKCEFYRLKWNGVLHTCTAIVRLAVGWMLCVCVCVVLCAVVGEKIHQVSIIVDGMSRYEIGVEMGGAEMNIKLPSQNDKIMGALKADMHTHSR